MKLDFELPEKAALNVRPALNGEPILFCLPYDLTAGGTFADGYFVMTTKKIIVLLEDEVVSTLPIEEGVEFQAVELNSSGRLEVKTGKDFYAVVNYSMAYVARYAYIARALEDLTKTGRTHVESNDLDEKRCPKCGRMYVRGTRYCRNCSDKLGILKRLLPLAKKEAPLFAVIIVLFLINSANALWMPAVNKGLINDVLDPATRVAPNISVLLFYVGLMALSNVLATTVNISRGIAMSKASSRLTMRLKSMVYEKIQQLSIGYIDTKKTGDLMNRINQDTTRIQNFMQNILSNGVNEVLVLVGSVFVLFAYNWKMALIVVVPAPFIVVIHRVTRRQMHKRYHTQWIKMDRLNSFLNDILKGIRVVKAFGQEKRAVAQFQTDAGIVRDVTTSNEMFYFTLFPIIQFIIGFGGYFLMLYSGHLVFQNELTIGEMVQFSTYAGFFYQKLDWLSFMPRWINEAVTSSQRIFEVMDEEVSMLEKDLARPEDMRGDIVFQNVTFGYKSYQSVLKNINLEVKEGEMIGLVGHSGAGKSTMINLIMRLYDPDEGAIRIGGTDIRDFSQADYKANLGVVLQETFLFSGTIAQNIAYSKPEATMDEIIRAAKIANAHDFIVRFPDGYDTRTGEKGQRLSGGERQRIAIARAILNDPKILILDEATASVDTATEQQIQEALQRVIQNRTTFAIAHRLSTLKNADRIVVLNKGEIAEVGTHDELLKKQGIYYSLVEAQRKMSAIKGV